MRVGQLAARCGKLISSAAIMLLLENFWKQAPIAPNSATDGRGGGIRTPTRGFGDRWSAVKPTPLHFLVYLISLCGWCLRQNGQNFFSSSRSVMVFLFFMLV